jgi:hypothetical protein
MILLQDYKELKERHIVQSGVSPAAALLEKNLVANHLKQQVMHSTIHIHCFVESKTAKKCTRSNTCGNG